MDIETKDRTGVGSDYLTHPARKKIIINAEFLKKNS